MKAVCSRRGKFELAAFGWTGAEVAVAISSGFGESDALRLIDLYDHRTDSVTAKSTKKRIPTLTRDPIGYRGRIRPFCHPPCQTESGAGGILPCFQASNRLGQTRRAGSQSAQRVDSTVLLALPFRRGKPLMRPSVKGRLFYEAIILVCCDFVGCAHGLRVCDTHHEHDISVSNRHIQFGAAASAYRQCHLHTGSAHASAERPGAGSGPIELNRCRPQHPGPVARIAFTACCSTCTCGRRWS